MQRRSTSSSIAINTEKTNAETTSLIFKTIASRPVSKITTDEKLKITNMFNTNAISNALETTSVQTNAEPKHKHETLKPKQTTVQATDEMIKITDMAGKFMLQTKNLTTDMEILSASYAIKTEKVTENTIVTTTSGVIPEHDKLNVESGDDTYWPLVLALAVGIPTIIVIGVTICVIHNRRKLEKAHYAVRTGYVRPQESFDA